MPTLHTTSRLSPAVFVLLLLHVLSSSSAVAQRNNILTSVGSSVTSCHCCYITPRSQCCVDCMTEGLTRGREQPRFAPLVSAPQRESLQNILGQDVDAESLAKEAAERWSEPPILDLPGCRCCMREIYHTRHPSLMLMACCGICEKNKHVVDVARHSLSHLPQGLDVSAGDLTVGDDDAEKDLISRHAAKRTPSVDCMCCSNTGLSLCCSECKIY